MPPPYTNPRITDASNFNYLGYFNVPGNDGAGGPMDFSQWGPCGIGPDNGANKTLIWSASDTVEMSFARVNIPTTLVTSGSPATATIANTVIQLPNRTGMWSNPANVDPNKRIGAGAYYHNGRYIFSGYPYYDGGGTADRSHWAVSSWSTSMGGPYQVGPTYNGTTELYRAGIAGGYMAAVPAEWQADLGGPVMTGLGAIAIISRSSYGPAAAVFDPDDLGVTAPVPVDKLVFYPGSHQNAGTFDSPGGPYPSPNYFTGADAIRGLAFPAGTRSVLFFGRHGTRGPTSSPAFANGCRYGVGTSTLALDGTSSGGADVYVYDPTDGGKGPHSYPYMLACWAYDANDLLAVKNGSVNPWDVYPYAMFDFAPGGPLSGSSANVVGATFDPRDNRLYISGFGQRVYVYEIIVTGSAGSSSVSPSSSASSSASPSVAPLDGIAWGVQTPAAGEEAVTWKRWQTAPNVTITVTGDQDWGTASIVLGTATYSPVTDTGDTLPKTFTAQTNKYGTGTGSTTMSIRGGAAPWAQHADEIAGPAWSPYTGPTLQSWRYVQLRLVTP